MKNSLIAAAALALAASSAIAQGPGYGPGMMGGYGPGYGQGMMGGYGPGYGPGMMGGYGPRGGYGPGMMGGYGPGMMGGHGGPLAALNLNDEQQKKIFDLQEQNRRKNFDTMSKMRAETFQLRRLYNADKIDEKAVLEQQKKVDELRRQLLASRLEMHQQMESVLTPEQRKELREFRPWWYGGDVE
jgi:Spy/CpxP family protein refolding chaperone